jgi:pimeloyl-ACP methyl ester carboxylesterase
MSKEVVKGYLLMANKNTGYVNVDGQKIYYEIGGDNQNETLVLSHAGFVDSGMWDAQWDAFTERYRVIRFDMRGFGKSDPVQGPVTRRQDLYNLLTQLGVKRAHILGCSMSGEIVIDFVLDHPEIASSLIVVSGTPSGFELKGEPPRYLMEMMEATKKGDLDKASELQLRIWIDGPFREPDQVDPKVRQHAAVMNRIALKNGTWAKADSQPLNPLDPPAVGRLKSIRIPTLIVAGALDDPEILRGADYLTSEIPNAKKVVISNAAHMPNMEKPKEFNQAVLDFLGAPQRV